MNLEMFENARKYFTTFITCSPIAMAETVYLDQNSETPLLPLSMFSQKQNSLQTVTFNVSDDSRVAFLPKANFARTLFFQAPCVCDVIAHNRLFQNP